MIKYTRENPDQAKSPYEHLIRKFSRLRQYVNTFLQLLRISYMACSHFGLIISHARRVN